jgi:exosortase
LGPKVLVGPLFESVIHRIAPDSPARTKNASPLDLPLEGESIDESMSVTILRKLYQPLAIAIALALLYFAVVVKLGNDWWHDENYSHGLLIPFIIGFILWQERERFGLQSRPATWGGTIGVGASLFALWAGTAGAELFVQRVSLVVMLASVVIYFFGFRLLRVVAVPLMLLVLSIPIPQIIFNRIAFPLQLFASRCAVAAMSFFSIPVLRQGNVIELMPLGATEPKKLAVVEACSGIRSLMTLVTLAMVYAYFTRPRTPGNGRYGIARFAILVLAALPIAIMTNALRVSGTGVLAHYYGTRVADGFFHSFSGWVIYIVAAALLFATGWVLDRTARFWNKPNSKTPSQSNSNRPLNEATLCS